VVGVGGQVMSRLLSSAVGNAGNSGTPPTLGITRPVRHRPSGHKLSRPDMPQGLSAGPQRPTRPGLAEAGQPPDRAERAEEHPGPCTGGPVRCGQRRTLACGGGGRFPG